MPGNLPALNLGEIQVTAVANKSGLYSALLEVQKEAPQLRKNETAEVKTKTGGKFSYTYLSLEALLSAVLPVLHAHDIVLVQSPSWSEGLSTLRTVLHHVPSGEQFEDTMLLLGTADSQAQGSAITYARRYSLMSMLGLAAEDDDGQKASRPQQQAQTTQGNGQRSPFVAPNEKPASKAKLTRLEGKVNVLIGEGHITQEQIDTWCISNYEVPLDKLPTAGADELWQRLETFEKNLKGQV